MSFHVTPTCTFRCYSCKSVKCVSKVLDPPHLCRGVALSGVHKCICIHTCVCFIKSGVWVSRYGKCMLQHTHVVIDMGQFTTKRVFCIKCYKISLCLNRCKFQTVKAIDFLFSKRHSTPLYFVKIYFGVL